MTPPQIKRLRLALPAGDNWSALHWRGWSDQLPVRQGTCPLEKLPEAEIVEVVVPWQRVSRHALTLPAKPGRHLDALIEQALEDRVLGDRAGALAIAGPQAGVERLVWVVERAWLDAAFQRLVGAGIHPNAVLPEPLLLPAHSDHSSYAVVNGGILFRTADHRFGVVRDLETLGALVPERPSQVLTDSFESPWPEGCPSVLPKALARFSRRRLNFESWLPALKWAGACMALVLLGQIVHWRDLEHRDEQLRHEIRQTFAAAFPGTPIIDPALQWESTRREAGLSGRDALEAVLALAERVNAPVHPRQVEAGDGFVRLTLNESEVAQYRAPLESVGKPETSSAEGGAGLLRLHYRSAP